jgi:NADH-quinone oxidoreductase subunit N
MPNDMHTALAQAVWLLTPEMILAGFACLVFLGGTFVANRNLWGIVALVGFGAAFLDAQYSALTPRVGDLYVVPVVIDSLALYSRYLALATGAILLLLSWHEVADRQAADHHACLLVLIAGVSLVGSANDLTTMFLALELISIPTYIMLYLPRADDKAQEAALKYFMLSIFSSAVLLFGFSYLFGITGSTNLSVILHTLNHNLFAADFPVASAIALVTIVCGLAFRITAVPFHFYAPDVYQGVANVNAALLAFIPKIAGLVALLRILGFVLPEINIAPARTIGVGLEAQHTPLLLWILSAITMSIGNLLALRQEHVRRILAYSSIAHAGYMLVALSAAPYLRRVPDCPDGVEAVLYYLVAYGVTTIGAFAILAHLDSENRRIDTLDDIAGLSTEHPGLAIALAIFIFSLVGIPLTAGFTGKFMIIFGTLALQEPHAVLYRVLALIFVLNSAIGCWYYLRIVAALFLRNPLKPFPTRNRIPAIATIVICLALTIGLSFPPGLTWMQRVVKAAAKNPSNNAVAQRD